MLSLLLLVSACADKKEEKKDAGNKATKVSVVKVQAQAVEVTEESVGSLESIIDPTVAAEISARVVKVLVHPGQVVKKGQLIAVLDATDFGIQRQEAQSEVARIQALIANQHKIVDRNRALVDKNFISKNALEDASTQLDALQQQLLGAKSRVAGISHSGAKNQVIAPTDGTVVTQIVSNGDYVKIGDPVVKIINNRLLRAHLPFPESVAAKLKPGLSVKITTPTSEQVVETTIREMKPQIDATNRSVDVTADIQGQIDWQPGASINGKVILGSRPSALMVPEESVVLRPAGEVVYQVVKKEDKSIAKQTIVKTGVNENGMIEVLQGLSGGETIVTDGAGFLTDGAPVKVTSPSGDKTKKHKH